MSAPSQDFSATQQDFEGVDERPVIRLRYLTDDDLRALGLQTIDPDAPPQTPSEALLEFLSSLSAD